MTDPSQYFKGRTVQEQMTEVIGYVDTRAAEVATDAIASDVAQVHQDMLDADADASAAAASAAAAAGTLANAVKKTGESSQSITGDISVSGDVGVGGDLSVTGSATVQTPVNDSDAATKKYVDDYHDATKISITDINSYAVGLTGNQDDIKGKKCFDSLLSRQPQARVGNTAAAKICGVPAAASTTYVFNAIVSTRYSVDIYHMSISLDADSTISSISADSISTATQKNSRIGAYIDGTQLIITARPTTSNTNVSGIILNCCYGSGQNITQFDYSMNTANITIASEPSYVEES